MSKAPNEKPVSVQRIFLDLKNPRFEEVETEQEAIDLLCNSKNNVYGLAADIVEQGSLNPLDRLALVPTEKKPKEASRQTYTVIEGNRRICALKLLADPQLAPSSLRKRFEKLAGEAPSIKIIKSMVFDDRADVKVWLSRMHDGEQGGIGRKPWTPEQKQRFSGSTKNQDAQVLLDYCEARGFITKEQREGKITTVSRFITNDVFRDHLGIEKSGTGRLEHSRPSTDFDTLAKTFVEDLIGKDKVNSRMNKPDIAKYARTLSTREDISNERIDPVPITVEKKVHNPARRPRPKPQANPKKLQHFPELEKHFKKLKNPKLISLYTSLVNVSIEDHCPLVSIGLWAFLETLTDCAGRPENSDFVAYLQPNTLRKLGITEKKDQKAIATALRSVQAFGNGTKHHRKAAAFNSKQLDNDFSLLEKLMTLLVIQAISSKSK